MYYDARVKIIYLLLYYLDLNPIKEFFAELKAFIKYNWQVYKADPSQGFDEFLEWYIKMVRSKE